MKFFKLTNEIESPSKAHEHDAGIDFYAPYKFTLFGLSFLHVELGVAIALEPGEFMLIQGRSSLAKNYGIFTIGNVIDSGYRGLIGCTLCNMSEMSVEIEKGDRICQGVIIKLSDAHPTLEEVETIEELGTTQRGARGFGSSGR